MKGKWEGGSARNSGGEGGARGTLCVKKQHIAAPKE